MPGGQAGFPFPARNNNFRTQKAVPFRGGNRDKREVLRTMANHNGLVKEQLLHMLFGTTIFVVLGGLAVSLDLAAAWVAALHVSEFTHKAIELTAHAMLLLDVALFALYLGRTSVGLVREMFK